MLVTKKVDSRYEKKTTFHTVRTWTLVVSSAGSVSLSENFFTQSHSSAQSCHSRLARPGWPVSQPLSRLSHHLDWQPWCSSTTLASLQHTTGLWWQSAMTGNSQQLQWWKLQRRQLQWTVAVVTGTGVGVRLKSITGVTLPVVTVTVMTVPVETVTVFTFKLATVT